MRPLRLIVQDIIAPFWRAYNAFGMRVAPDWFKAHSEMVFWRSRFKREGGRFNNDHFEFNYTTLFQLPLEFYRGKRVLDIGCGPRGSLEWASMAAQRVGLDPLLPGYLKEFQIDRVHQMQYVAAPSECMPFPDRSFDVVCAFNSLDHVEDLSRVISEIRRVLTPSGTFLLIVELNHPPTATEPYTISEAEARAILGDGYRLQDFQAFEIGDHNIYRQVRENRLFDYHDQTTRPAIAAARFTGAGLVAH